MAKIVISLRIGYYIVLPYYPPLDGHPPSLTTPPTRVLPPGVLFISGTPLNFNGTVFWPVVLLGEL